MAYEKQILVNSAKVGVLLSRNNLHFYQSTTGSLSHAGERKECVHHNKLKQVTKERLTETVTAQLARYTLLSKVKKILVQTAKQGLAAGLYFSDQNTK